MNSVDMIIMLATVMLTGLVLGKKLITTLATGTASMKNASGTVMTVCAHQDATHGKSEMVCATWNARQKHAIMMKMPMEGMIATAMRIDYVFTLLSTTIPVTKFAKMKLVNGMAAIAGVMKIALTGCWEMEIAIQNVTSQPVQRKNLTATVEATADMTCVETVSAMKNANMKQIATTMTMNAGVTL